MLSFSGYSSYVIFVFSFWICGYNAATQNMTSKTRSHVADRADGNENKKSPVAAPAFKKRHRGCSFCILDIENTPIPEFPPNEVVVGVISMEDVIEELLQVIT